MEPGVPFALLGAVQLLLVAAWCALAGAAVALRRGRLAALLVVLGALLLAAVDVRTALRFGRIRSDDLAVARAAGALLLAAGLGTGALRAQRVARVVPEAFTAVIVPLASAPGPAALAGACTAIAAAVAARVRRDLAGLLLAAGLGAAAVAAAAAPLADDSASGSVLVLALRGAAAVGLLAGLVALARASLLGKVVAAILAGVLAMAAAAVGVVGTNVVSSYQQQANALVEEGTYDRLAALNRVGEAAQPLAKIIALDPRRTCPNAIQCNRVLNEVVSGGATNDFVVLVGKNGPARSLGGRAPLGATELLGVSRDPDVRALFTAGVRLNVPPIVRLRLLGSPPVLAVAAASLQGNLAAPTSAVLYGVRIDDDYAASDIAAASYGLSFLVDGKVVASNLPDRERATLQQIADDAGVEQGMDTGGITTPAEGSRPTVHFAPVLDNADHSLGVIAVSREASASLAAQRSALTSLFVTALLATALVGSLALLLGRRTVDPVRRLTAAAARVSAGDLDVSTSIASADEVGTLSRTFDAMTASLSRLTGDLRSSAARLETVLSSMSDGLVATDADGRVTSINPAALQMVGLESAGEAIGQPIGDVVDVRDAAGSSLADPALRLFDAAGEVHRAADETVPVRVSLAPLDSGDGVVLVLRDTTREREVERMKTEFLSNVSHELRTPLTPIRGYAEILVAKPGLDTAKVMSFATTIRDESIKMNRVVDLLVDVAAIEAGRVTITPRPVAVKSLVDARLEVWKARVPARAKDLRKRVGAGLPPVLVDPEWVGKALDELIDNAVKYTAPGTAVTLTATRLDETVRVGVRDAGPGIAEADQRTLFTPFEQVDGSATRRVGGLGLGLSFVRRLAEEAGFPLSVTSTLGKGSEFSLDLPVSDQPVPTARRASRAKRRPAPARGRAR